MRIPPRLPAVAFAVGERPTKGIHVGNKRLRVDTLRFERQPAGAQRKKVPGYAVGGIRVLVGAIGIATLLGGCDTRSVPDAPAEPATSPARSIATIDESLVSIPETVSGQAAGDENQTDENETDENEVEDCVADENETDENETDENESDEDETNEDL